MLNLTLNQKKKLIIIPNKKTEKMRINFLYVNTKNKNNKILTFKLKANGKIITLKKLFKTSDLKKLNVLFKKSIL